MVKKAVREFHERKLKEEVETNTKLKDIKHENFKLKEYFRGKNLTDTRLMFRIKSRMQTSRITQDTRRMVGIDMGVN